MPITNEFLVGFPHTFLFSLVQAHSFLYRVSLAAFHLVSHCPPLKGGEDEGNLIAVLFSPHPLRIERLPSLLFDCVSFSEQHLIV